MIPFIFLTFSSFSSNKINLLTCYLSFNGEPRAPSAGRKSPQRNERRAEKRFMEKKVRKEKNAEELSVDPSSERQTFASRGQRR